MVAQPLVGKLEKVPLPHVLRELYLSRTSGVLELRVNRDQRRIILDSGDVRSARSNRMEQRIGQFALNNGAITRIQLMQALSIKDTDTPLGRKLVNLGVLSDAQLDQQLQALAQEIIVECFGWDSGDYRFQAGIAMIPPDTEIHIPTGNIIFQGFKAHATERMARRMIGDLNSPLIPNPNLRLLFQHITLEDEERDVLEQIDGSLTTAQLVCTMAGETDENIILLGSLMASGLLSSRAREETPSRLGFPARMDNAPPPPDLNAPPAPAAAEPPPPAATTLDPVDGPQEAAASGPAVPPPEPTGPPRRKATTGPPRRAATTPGAAKPQPSVAGTTTGVPQQPTAKPPTRREKGLFTSKPKPKQVGFSDKELDRMRKSIRERYQMLEYANHYQLLGLPVRATQKEIYYTFNMLCTLFHPDLAHKEKFSDLKRELEAVFSRLEEAYETLVDTASRKRYDRSIKWD